MLLMTEPTLFFWNLISNHQDDDSAKEAFLGHMNQWITTAAKSGKPKAPSQPVKSSLNTASSIQISSFSNVTAPSKATSCPSAIKPPPSHSPSPLNANSDGEDEFPAALLDEDDTAEREAAHSLMNLSNLQMQSQSKEESVNYGQPPYTQKPIVAPTVVKTEPTDIPMDVMVELSDTEDNQIIINDSELGCHPVPVAAARSSTCQKWTTTIVTDHSTVPSSKCSRTRPASGCVQDGTAADIAKKVKYNNSHIPAGAMTDNKWCVTLIPTYAKWNGMLNVCWGTKSSYEVEV
ncbi:hypothetical protein PAXRUDRAFT_16910 [Paxillus rubicundulus Ve08.2h10]|uniref:Uncharacterized protein n=1 Tax=Paxillus rubicundulus Ve08.2h10 TaxID=930991 RepID=A0A0D0CSN1_9AGAM|nr:hypothetical protein PAXRUDRAFT_16910 [Paxillus rubicundulus Ve08.2h10]